MRPSLWMFLPLLTSPYKGEGKCGSPYKGEGTEWRPHKSLKSHNIVTLRGAPAIAFALRMSKGA